MPEIPEQLNDRYKRLTVAPIARADAKRLVIENHYMKTFPQGAAIDFGVFDGDYVVGVCVFGYSPGTDAKVARIVGKTLPVDQYLEMMRFWISDEYGHNSESYVLSQIMKELRRCFPNMKIIVTHAGGCKNDCGIVYQASGWMYFGKEPCNDFYLTANKEYKNLIAPMRFGRVNARDKTPQQIGEELFGPGEIIHSFRYLYAYPIHKGLRRRLQKTAVEFPKDSGIFRRNQHWVLKEGSNGVPVQV